MAAILLALSLSSPSYVLVALCSLAALHAFNAVRARLGETSDNHRVLEVLERLLFLLLQVL